jgi:hypothetical protein
MTEYKFIDFVTEGKMIRTSDGVSRMSFTDANDLVLLYMLALQTMRYYPISNNFARSYAKEVLKWNDWENFRSSGNDLYNLLNIVSGDLNIVKKLKSPKSAMALRMRTHLPVLSVKRLLRSIANNEKPNSQDSTDLLKINSSLRNSQFGNLRRKVTTYKQLSAQQRKELVTQIEFALKARGRNSDIVDYFIMFVKDYDLESKTAKDPFPRISVSDPVQPDSKDINMLRLLGVPTRDLPFAYKVLSMTSRGLGLPPRFAQAYKPIMQIIDDIMKAGPGYVNILKTIHNRARSSKK